MSSTFRVRLLLGWIVLCVLAAPRLVSAQILGSGTITTNGDSVAASLLNVSSATVKVAPTFTGTLTFRVAQDGGSCVDPWKLSTVDGALVLTTTAPGTWIFNNPGFTTLCVTATSAITGSTAITITRGFSASGGGGGGGGGGGAMTVADGANVVEGVTTDAAVTGDNPATINGHLRGITKVFPTALGANGGFKIEGVASGVAVPISALPAGSASIGTVQPGNTANTTPWLFTPYQGGANLFPNAGALADGTSNPTATGIASYMMCFNGTTWDRCKPSTLLTHGASATWSTTTGGALLAHAKATAPTAVTADQPVAPWGDLNGRLQINGDASMTPILTTPAAGSTVVVTPSSASGAALTWCDVQSGTGSTASTNAANCLAAAGNLYDAWFVNSSTTIAFVRFYNLSSSPTCSSATGFVFTMPVPPAAAAGGAGGIVRLSAYGRQFATGIGWCITGGGSSTDNTNAPAGVYGSVGVK